METTPILRGDGRKRADAFLALGFFVRTVAWLRFVLIAAFGGAVGVVILRGDDGIRREPRVLLSWESYCTLLLMAKPAQLPDMTMCEDNPNEMGG